MRPARKKQRNGAAPLWSATNTSFPHCVGVYSMMPRPASTILVVPKRHQQYVRTSNLVGRAFVEERRRTKVIPHLWAEGSLVHLVFGVLIRVSDRWARSVLATLSNNRS